MKVVVCQAESKINYGTNRAFCLFWYGEFDRWHYTGPPRRPVVSSDACRILCEARDGNGDGTGLTL